MNELMNVKGMSSKEIAILTGKEHKSVIRDIKDEIAKLELGGELGEHKFVPSSYTSKQGKIVSMYKLSLEGVLQLAARYDAVTRSKLITMAMKSQTQTIMLPQTYLEALKELVVKEEQNQLLLTENVIMKPKVEYYEEVLQSSRLSSFTEVAKDLGMTAQQLGRFLQDEKILFKKNNTYHLYKKHSSLLPLCFDYHITKFGQNLKITEQGRKFIIDKIKFRI